MTYHRTVLPAETLDYLKLKPGQWYLDATLGDGGHSQLLLEKGARVWAIDQDEEAINRASDRLQAWDKDSFRPTLGNFAKLSELWQEQKLPLLAGILFDLGASTLQLTSPERGFSFTGNAPLDMRMDQTLAATAADLVNALSESELTRLFGELGGEPKARTIAKAIVRQRQMEAFATTDQLASLIAKVKPRMGKLHPATKVFQALRMAVNGERAALRAGLEGALSVLAPQGRLVVISFHEGEDAIVKQFLKTAQLNQQLTQLTPKPVVPTALEIDENPRARSAKLRAAQKI